MPLVNALGLSAPVHIQDPEETIIILFLEKQKEQSRSPQPCTRNPAITKRKAKKGHGSRASHLLCAGREVTQKLVNGLHVLKGYAHVDAAPTTSQNTRSTEHSISLCWNIVQYSAQSTVRTIRIHSIQILHCTMCTRSMSTCLHSYVHSTVSAPHLRGALQGVEGPASGRTWHR